MRDRHQPDQEILPDPVGRINPRGGHMFSLEDVRLSDFQVRSFESLSGDPIHIDCLIINGPSDLGCGMIPSDARSLVSRHLRMVHSHNPHSGKEHSFSSGHCTPVKTVSHPSAYMEELS